MGKPVHKYNSLKGTFICTYKSIQQAANDADVDESTIRKQINNKDLSLIKGHLYSLRRCDNILEGSDYAVEEVAVKLPHKANILLIDIETAPTIAGVWRFWKYNIAYNQIFDHSYILSYSCKWLLDSETYSSVLTPSEAILNDDSRLLKELWRWLDSADIIIAHNGKGFDIPRINTRLVRLGMPPTSSYQVIDTLEAARKFFDFPSNTLKALAEFLGLTPKIENEGFELWKRCISGDEEALGEMEKYNIGDVITLEDVYMSLRPYIRPHPNMGLFVEGEVRSCPTCGGSNVIENGFYTTPMNKYKEFTCTDCGASGRSRYAEPKFKQMLSSISH